MNTYIAQTSWFTRLIPKQDKVLPKHFLSNGLVSEIATGFSWIPEIDKHNEVPYSNFSNLTYLRNYNSTMI